MAEALLAIDNRSGQIRAMVGGFSFARSKFNRATQARRQVGSSFKPIVFTAAIDRGYTATSMLIDTPASFPAGPNQPPYEPRNYDRKYEGSITLRRALEVRDPVARHGRPEANARLGQGLGSELEAGTDEGRHVCFWCLTLCARPPGVHKT